MVDEETVANFDEILFEPFGAFREFSLKQDTLKALRSENIGGLDRDTRRELSDKLYSYLNDNIWYRIICVAMHQDELDQLDGEETVQFAFTMLVERFEWLLEKLDTPDYGIVFLDTTSRIAQIQEEHSRISRQGSGYKSIDQVISVGAPIRDEYSLGIQLADLILTGVEAHFIDNFSYYYDNYFEEMMYGVDRNSIKGNGLKVHPEESYSELSNSV